VHLELYNRVYEKTPEGIPLYPWVDDEID
jgi:hypothetical protein